MNLLRSKRRSADRAAETDSLIDRLTKQLHRHAELDVTSIQHQYRHLMPELAERLRSLQAIEAAARQAEEIRRETHRSDVPDPHDAVLKEEWDFLRQALPEYELVDRIHRGGQGVVYEAVERATRRTVALKLLRDGPLASERQHYRFSREVELVSRLRHPNIVTLLHTGVVRGRPFFAMEYIDGLPIDDFAIMRELSARQIVRLFVTICNALTYAHQRGIIHRDLKPSNILVDVEAQPHVLDFGLAKDIAGSDGGTNARWVSMPGRPVGTLPYLSPEQLEVAGDVDTRSDIYSLAVVLFQVVSGAFPYSIDGDPQTVRRQILEHEPARLRDIVTPTVSADDPAGRGINEDLESVLLKALEKDKSRRYQNMEAFAADLERYLAGEAVHAKAHNRLYVVRKTLRKYRVHAAIAASFLLVIVVAGILVATQWVRASRQRDNARETAQVANAALSTTLNELIDGIDRLPGGMAVRDRILHDVEGHLDRLGPLIESDVAMGELLAAWHEQRGNIARAQGRDKAAHREFAVLVGMLRAQVNEDPSIDRRRALVVALRRQARFSTDWESLFTEAITLGTDLLDEVPADEELQRIVCEARLGYARRLSLGDEPLRAEGQLEAALALAQPHLQSAPGAEWMELVGEALEIEGDVRLQLGQGDRALAAREEALQVHQDLVRDRPSDTRDRRNLMVSAQKLAFLRRDAGDTSEAQKLLEEAIEIGDDLLSSDPANHQARDDLYASYDGLARLYLVTDLARSDELSAAALDLMRDLPEAKSNHSLWRGKLGVALKLRGRVLLKLGRIGEGHGVLTEACVTLRRQLEDDAGDSYLTLHLAETLDRIGKACKQLGRIAEELEHYEEAHSLRSGLLDASPDLVICAEQLIISDTKIGEWHFDRNTTEHDLIADQWYAKADAGLRLLEKAGHLRGREAKFDAWRREIDQFLAELDERSGRRDGSADQRGS